jgi:DNA-directed RNA polymerase subunit RPC12/RpoP
MKDGHCLRTIHAEANAICFAAKHGISLKGATLYVTGYAGGCCHACEKLALSAGIAQIISEPYYTCMSCNAKVLCTDRPKISGGKFINGGSYDFGRGTGIAPDVCKNCWSEGKRVLNHMSGVK